MTIPETNIELVFRRQDFEEIYFKDGQANIFKNAAAKDTLIPVLFFGLLCLVLSYFYLNTINFIMPVLSFIPFGITVYIYIKWVLQILEYRKWIRIYLDGVAKIKKHALTLTDGALCLTFDDKIDIIKWTSFNRADITEIYIELSSRETYTFPRKSMTASEYEFLKSVVLYKMKHCLDEEKSV